MKKFFLLTTLLLFFALFSPQSVHAQIGVGVGVGKIIVDEELKPGIIYKLPVLPILNTGSQPSKYEAEVTYHQNQPELQPPQEWIKFSPKQFHLEPGKAQVVEITLNLPVKAVPGDYFAYLEGHPVVEPISGVTSIGVAAAAKLYFTVAPANFIEGVYYKIISFLKINQPWTNRIGGLIAIIAFFLTFKRFFNIQINVKDKNQPKDE